MKNFLQTPSKFIVLGTLALALGLMAILRVFRGGALASQVYSPPYPPPDEGLSTKEATTLNVPYPPPEDASPIPTPIQQFTGPTCFVDPVNHFSLWLSPGWYAYAPPADRNRGGSYFYNYDPEEIERDHGAANLPPGSLKITIGTGKRDTDQSLEQWLSGRIAPKTPGDPASKTVHESHPYQLGKYEGIAFVTTSFDPGTLQIVLSLSGERVMVITIEPADSPALSDALSMLSTLDASGVDSCLSGAVAPEKQDFALPVSGEKLPSSPSEYTCSLGTFPGTEARRSTIPLQMPFRVGETWIVGGEGSFYGNYHHCNYYNNYYATDWNRPDDNDLGALVVAVADGTVSAIFTPPCNSDPDNRYGCYVQIDHIQGHHQTLYAHLDDVTVIQFTPGTWLDM